MFSTSLTSPISQTRFVFSGFVSSLFNSWRRTNISYITYGSFMVQSLHLTGGCPLYSEECLSKSSTQQSQGEVVSGNSVQFIGPRSPVAVHVGPTLRNHSNSYCKWKSLLSSGEWLILCHMTLPHFENLNKRKFSWPMNFLQMQLHVCYQFLAWLLICPLCPLISFQDFFVICHNGMVLLLWSTCFC